MRIDVLILLLACAIPSSLAIRGEMKSFHRGRHLEDPKKAGPKKDDEKKEDPTKKKDDPKKCKKAKNHIGKDKSIRRKLAIQHVRGRNLQIDDPVGDQEVGTPYCLHGSVSKEQCADLNQVPKGKSLSSDLTFELVHASDETAEDVLDGVEEILNDDSVGRFVGCIEMKSPPKKKKAPDETRRYLLEDEVLFDDLEESIGVTGIEFGNLDVVRDGCVNSNIPVGSICDLIQSDVTMFYEGATDPTEAEVDDMKNLLVETILSQTTVGSFEGLGRLQNITVGDSDGRGEDHQPSSNGDTEAGDENADNKEGMDDDDAGKDRDISGSSVGDDAEEKEEGGGILKFVLAGVAAAIVFGIATWYGLSGGKDDDSDDEEKNRDTSDSEDDLEPESNSNNNISWGFLKSKEEDEKPAMEATSAAQSPPKSSTSTRQQGQSTQNSSKPREDQQQSEEEGWFDGLDALCSA